MASEDLFNNVEIREALPTAAITSDTTTVGAELDTKGFESALIAIQSGVVTDGTFIPLLEEADDDGSGSPAAFSAVADADMIPQVAAEVGAQFVAADDNTVAKIGYRGNKRWLRLSIVSTGTTTGALLSASLIMNEARHLPKDTQVVV